jgi:tryptophan-rich sensory protein
VSRFAPARDLPALLVAVAVCEGVGIVSAFFTTRAIPTWYATLVKPSFNPPNWVFGPVWTTLYALMGVALFLVWRAGLSSPGARAALALFAVQLALNFAWSWLFFGIHQPGWAFAEIVALWVAIAATIVTFFGISRAAGWLMSPYLAWVSFAAALNFAYWRLNRG